jgi:hypothetical protein
MKRMMTALAVLGLCLAPLACTGGSAYVGVYGAPVYGPGPWGPYGRPYPGYGYPPGGVWVGVPVCCDEEQQQEEPDEPEDADSAEREPAGGGS